MAGVVALVTLTASCGSQDDEPAAATDVESAESAAEETIAEDSESETETETDAAEAAPDATAESEPAADPAEDGVDMTSELFPDVVNAEATADDDGSWTFSATLSSPYDSAQRYADAWRVVGPDGEVYGIRELTHDHASEQPFTRSHSGIEIPQEVSTVTVEGRDQISGWGGATAEVELVR